MKADEETIRQRMEIIAENKEYIESVRESFDPEKADFESLQAVKHCLFEIAEACIDISSHIIASEGFERPDDYSGLFPVLAENEILDEELAQRLAEMARFRNFLIHRYGEVEGQRLKRFMEDDLEDVSVFTEQVYDYLETS